MRGETVLTNDKQFQMRVSEEFLATLDGWRRLQPDIPPRAEAVRRLVDLGIRASEAPAHEHQPATTPSSEPSLLTKFREFVITNATTDMSDDEDRQLAISLAEEVVALSDDDLEQALMYLAIDLTGRRADARRKEAKRVASNAKRRQRRATDA